MTSHLDPACAMRLPLPPCPAAAWAEDRSRCRSILKPTGNLLASFALAALLATATRAGVIHVPGDQPTIQTGISAASDGDTVLVAPGTYVENLIVLEADIVIRSSGGPEATILDGSQPTDPDTASVVRFRSSNGGIEGFDLHGGQGTLFGGFGRVGGGTVASGAYVARIRAGREEMARTLLLVR